MSDHGPGIAAEHRERVFPRFERASDSRHGGLGLGLFVTSEIVAAHRGTIALSGREGGGAVFTIDVPRSGRSPS